MPERDERIPRSERSFDRGYDGHRRRQGRKGLQLTPAQRLRWLEETMDELRAILGRARHGKRVDPI